MTVTRRRLMQRVGGTGAFTLISRPTRSLLAAPDRAPLLTGTEFELDIEPVLLTIVAGPWRPPSTAKSLPRSCAGAKATPSRLASSTAWASSIHWHGVSTPSPMDGVPASAFAASRLARPSSTASRLNKTAPTGTTDRRMSRKAARHERAASIARCGHQHRDDAGDAAQGPTR
jgi:hypothetical protein